jgi:hypothetical protein
VITCWNPKCPDPGFTDRVMALGSGSVSNPRREPYLGESVHYVAYGTPGGEYKSVCRAAIVTETNTGTNGRQTSIAVINPTGLFFHDSPHDEDRAPGSFHFAH